MKTWVYKRFIRSEDGKYRDQHGNEVTSEMLMNNSHEIFEDVGYIKVSEIKL